MLPPTQRPNVLPALPLADALANQLPREDVWDDVKLFAIYPRPPASLQLFPPHTAPSPYDVQQHVLLNDCHILAPMMAVVSRFAYYPHCAVKNLGHAVQVRYFPAVGEALTQVTLSTDLLHVSFLGTHIGAGRPWLWPTYLEKAWAATHGGLAALRALSQPSAAFRWLLGCPSVYVAIEAHPNIMDVLATLSHLYSQGECIVVFTSRHCYAVVGLDDLDKPVPSLALLDPRRNGFGRRKYSWSPSMTHVRYIGYAYTCGAVAATNSMMRLDTARP